MVESSVHVHWEASVLTEKRERWCVGWEKAFRNVANECGMWELFPLSALIKKYGRQDAALHYMLDNASELGILMRQEEIRNAQLSLHCSTCNCDVNKIPLQTWTTIVIPSPTNQSIVLTRHHPQVKDLCMPQVTSQQQLVVTCIKQAAIRVRGKGLTTLC